MVDLRRLTAQDLESLLEEETAAWRDEMEWDFDKSAELVRRFVDLRALNGSAIVEDGEVAGYAYYVLEENKALIGDLYVRRALRTVERENLLLESALEPIMANSFIGRIESQLMMAGLAPGRKAPYADYLSVYERNFMRLDLGPAALAEGNVRRPMYLENWSDHYQDAAAQLIAAAYAGHIDSRINDQYRSAPGARRFLYNIMQSPGCGAFFRPASYVGAGSGERAVVRHLAGQPGVGGVRPYHADLRYASGAGDGHRTCAAAPVADHPARDGLPRGQPHGNGRQRRRHGALRAGGIPDGETVSSVRVGRVLRLAYFDCVNAIESKSSVTVRARFSRSNPRLPWCQADPTPFGIIRAGRSAAKAPAGFKAPTSVPPGKVTPEPATPISHRTRISCGTPGTPVKCGGGAAGAADRRTA